MRLRNIRNSILGRVLSLFLSFALALLGFAQGIVRAPEPAFASTNVSGTIGQDTTWTAAAGPYVVTGSITVATRVRLTIEPGTIVKFQGTGLTVDGTLIADGTSQDKIYFTSIKDDSVGGDTNGDGAATAPAKADWYSIDLKSGSSASIIDNAVVRYGSKNFSPWYCWAPLRIFTNSHTISNTEFAYNNGYAMVTGTNVTLN